MSQFMYSKWNWLDYCHWQRIDCFIW